MYLGREGLEASQRLIDQALRFQPNVALRDHLYRVALTEQHEKQLRLTAKLLPEICTWEEEENDSEWRGALRLSNGCQVIHVPSYLQGLWKACQKQADDGGHSIKWITGGTKDCKLRSESSGSDAIVVWCAGSGLFTSATIANEVANFPVQLVRGQSVEALKKFIDEDTTGYESQPALLCGKYVCPLPDSDRILIGATHEFGPDPFPAHDVVSKLRQQTEPLQPSLWTDGKLQVGCITSGTRVQTERGSRGRLPILGRIASSNSSEWIFTGLSSRGLLYHALLGEWLAEAILADSDEILLKRFPEANWWRGSCKNTHDEFNKMQPT